MKSDRIFLTHSLFLSTRILAATSLLLLLTAQRSVFAQAPPSSEPRGCAPIAGAIYETSFRKDNVEIFSEDGVYLGLVGKIYSPTGLAFDSAGNLFVASDNRAMGYSIKKVSATDGTITTFTTASLNGPHGLAFDQAGNLYVANNNNSTIIRLDSAGVATTFAGRSEGLLNPIGLVFDTAGNLLVTNTHGGLDKGGRVIMLSPTGEPTVLVDEGLQVPYGIVIDSGGNFYVSNYGGNRVEKFAPDGTDLGVFCSSGCNAPYGMTFDDAGNLYVANNNTATIEKYAPDGTDLGVFATTRKGPHFLAIYRP